MLYLNKLLNIYLNEWKDNDYFKSYVVKASNKSIKKKPSKNYKLLELLEIDIKEPCIHVDNINPNKLSIRQFDISLEGQLYFKGIIEVKLKIIPNFINRPIFLKLKIYEVYGKIFFL